MRIRDLNRFDLEADKKAIDLIYQQYHADYCQLPSLKHEITHGLVEAQSGELIGFGMVHVVPEALMILNLSADKVDRLEATSMLMEKAIKETKRAGFKELYCFPTKPVENLIVKRYNFKNIGVVCARIL